jgi:hypothetical protein
VRPELPTIEERESASPGMQRQLALQCRHVKHLRRLSEARANAQAHGGGNTSLLGMGVWLPNKEGSTHSTVSTLIKDNKVSTVRNKR